MSYRPSSEIEKEIEEIKASLTPKIQEVRDTVKARMKYLRSQLTATRNYEKATQEQVQASV